jgi:uncharacterized protein YacL (UPF0231 family)
MNDNELIKTELCLQGIYVDGSECVSTKSGKEVRCSLEEQVVKLRTAIKQNKALIREIWQEMIDYISEGQSFFIGGGENTQRMFTNAIRMLYRTCKRFNAFNAAKSVFYHILCQDSVYFSEQYMSKIVDFSMAIDWLHHLVRNDMYRVDLISAYLKNISKQKTVTADGNYGIFPLEMRERVWSFKEDEDDRDDAKNNPVYDFWHRRNEISEKYNDPYSFDEGFVWRELRNDPYEFGDEDEDPYPHSRTAWEP